MSEISDREAVAAKAAMIRDSGNEDWPTVEEIYARGSSWQHVSPEELRKLYVEECRPVIAAIDAWDKMHNSEGHPVTAPDPRVGEIQAPPVAFHKLTRAQLLTLAIALEDQRDTALGLLQERDEALARVEALAAHWSRLADGDRHYARRVRAAVAAANGDN